MLRQTATIIRCSACYHPESAHHPSMEWCTHRVDDAACVCEQFVAPEASVPALV